MRYGSDLIVDLLVDHGVDYVSLNPGASFRGIHESLGQAQGAPALVLCLHESVAVAVAQGYGKAAGKPMAVLLHDVVGLQNASMAIYNAWCDRAPMLLIGGTGPKSKAQRRPWIDWIHTANAQAEIVRNYVKWDDEPHDAASIPESFARAYTTATSEPTGPVYLCYDVALQEDPLPGGGANDATAVARYATPTPPAPAEADVLAMLEVLRGARAPVILVGHVDGDREAMRALGDLAHELGAAVVDTGVRLGLATNHPLNATGIEAFLAEADVALVLDVDDVQLRLGKRFDDASLTILTVGLGHLRLRGWSHDYQALAPSACHLTASATTAVKMLLDCVRRTGAPDHAARSRAESITARTSAAREQWRHEAAQDEAAGAVSLARLVHLTGEALEGRAFVLANGTNERHELRLWHLAEPRQYLGWHSGGGLGYGVGAAIGAALAQERGVITVDIQADGDLLFLPSALWTAAHLGLATLFVVNNNRQYGNTVGHAASLAKHRGRPDRRYHGAGLTDPPVDLAGMARSFGVWSAGPITDPETLGARLVEAVEVVAGGRPALLDVVTPGH
jgi:thiamine pyrophosphate-dependent acetolactate synthase large subunit-like protein